MFVWGGRVDVWPFVVVVAGSLSWELGIRGAGLGPMDGVRMRSPCYINPLPKHHGIYSNRESLTLSILEHVELGEAMHDVSAGLRASVARTQPHVKAAHVVMPWTAETNIDTGLFSSVITKENSCLLIGAL